MAKTAFTDGDKSLGIPGTRVLAAFLNKLFSHRHDGLDADGSAPLNYAVAAGNGAAYTVALTPVLPAHIAGMPIVVKFTTANTTTTPTVAFDGLGGVQMQRKNGVALKLGDIAVNHFVVLAYNGSSYDVINPYLRESIIQTVQTVNSAYSDLITSIPFDDTIPQIGEGTELMAAPAITPISTANWLEVEIQVQAAPDSSGTTIIALFRDAGANALAAVFATTAGGYGGILTIKYRVAAGSLAATTFRVRGGVNGATHFHFNGIPTSGAKFGGICNSFIKVSEIQQ